MKGVSPTVSIIIFRVIITLQGLSSLVNSQTTDSCSSNPSLGLPFDTSSLQCLSVWSGERFILRYAQNSSNVWSFVLSAPDSNNYIAIGFSTSGKMVQSSAVVGWIWTNGTSAVKQYYLGGQQPNLVAVDQGSLQIVSNSTSITSQSGSLFMAFQLNTAQPQSALIYAVGPTAVFPSAPSYTLTQHRNRVSTQINYFSGQTTSQSPSANLRKSHGILNMVGWGILMLIGGIVARHFKQWDPIWFYSHVAIQSLGFVLGLIGVICGFVLEDRLSAHVPTHKGLGIFILVLGCLQVMAFLARPNKTSKVRKYWNWYHYSVGRILMVFAIANIFYGIHLGKEGHRWTAGYAVVIALLFLIAIVLEIRMWMTK
ncbi:hypothetical protein SLEP1_g10897 [Rubroshorea leprosula]|uniref:Cytochrome b561 and DOMON domain-containing protein n=1 Tax=Rubroshorea leprosula TaxID=152421 RepID=A0AAV5IFH0_9ROSI|nr:hypothetical protein SLEP1_g10897 [Rubroshorea leprosula]